MERLTLYLTRHGQTLENIAGQIQGQIPGHLSPLGLEQAGLLAEKMKDVELDAIVCSDLARSFDTASAVARRKGMEPEPTPLLREMNWACYAGSPLREVDWHHLPEGVETLEELYDRAGRFLEHLRKNYAGKRVLAVGHGIFNRAVLAVLQARPVEGMLDIPIMENTQVLRLEC